MVTQLVAVPLNADFLAAILGIWLEYHSGHEFRCIYLQCAFTSCSETDSSVIKDTSTVCLCANIPFATADTTGSSVAVFINIELPAGNPSRDAPIILKVPLILETNVFSGAITGTVKVAR